MFIERDKLKNFVQGSLFRRLLLLFIIFGLLPTLIFSVAPFLIQTKSGQVLIEEMPVAWRVWPTIIIGIGFLLVVILGGFITFTQLILPIQTLAQGAEAISAGDYTYRIKTDNGNDEMATLTAAFNTMAASVQKMHAKFEKQKEAAENTLIERENEFAVISQIADILNRPSDITAKLAEALNVARSALGPDILVVTLLDPQSEELSLAAFACNNRDQEHLYRHCKECCEHGLIRQAIQSRQVLFVQDTLGTENMLTPQQRKSYQKLNVRQIAIKPIIMKGKALGAVTFMRYEQTPIPQKKIDFAELLVQMMAVLIENATLQSQVRDLSIIEERRRIASDLHDSVMQSVFTLSLTVEGLKSSLAQDAALNARTLDWLAEQIAIIQSEMRTLINELRPVDLVEGGLDAALHRHASSLRRATSTNVTVNIESDLRDLPLTVQQNLNRISQEALSNIGRHANATQVDITVAITNDVVTLAISDDGNGFNLQAITQDESSSLGLISMRERAELLNGVLIVRSEPGEGTMITVKVPLSQSATNMELSNV